MKRILGAALAALLLCAPLAHADGPVWSSTSPGSGAASDADVFSNDVSQYQTVTVQFTGVGSGNTVTFAGSNDGTNWITQPGVTTAGATHTGIVVIATGIGYITPLTTKYWRARVTTYGSGTVTAIATFKHIPTPSLAALGAATIVGGPAVDDAAASGNPVPVGGKYNATRPIYSDLDRTQLQSDTRGNLAVSLFIADSGSSIASAAPSDGGAASTGSLRVGAYPHLFNNSTYDRVRSIINATDSTGTGIAAAGLVAQLDETSPTATTENQFGNVRMTSTGGLIGGHVLTNGATTENNFGCNSFAAISVTAGNTTQIIALSGSTVIRACTIVLSTSLTGTFTLLSGTGSNCGTPANSTGAIPILTATPVVIASGSGAVYRGSAGGELCVAAATGNVTGYVMYAQY